MSFCPSPRSTSAASKSPPRPTNPAWLDDAGLRPSQFRVYYRVVRRDGTARHCFESLESIAAACHLRRVTVQKALQELVELGLIEAEPQPGKTTIYRVVNDPPQKEHYVSTLPKKGTR
jgi:predicted transcriptional regulator